MPTVGPTKPPAGASPRAAWSARISHHWRKEIWKPQHLNDRSARGRFLASHRLLAIIWTAFNETKIPSRAAALSFSSLLGFGPLLALSVLIGGFVLGKNDDPKFVANQLGAILESVAPQLKQLENLNASAASTAKPGDMVAPGLVDFLNGIISGARSGSAGFFGALSLTGIVLLLFKNVEDAFNDIWGVRLGRSLLMRIVFYWTILTLGAVLFFGALALGAAGVFVNVFNPSIGDWPGGNELLAALRWSVPAFSFTLLTVLLTLVYRVIPNTRVYWRAAFVGALVVTVLMLLNNFVAFFYVRRVILTKSLYGSLALPIVMMLGLYIFWLYLLIGGVISYAVQNVHLRNSQAAWSQLNETMRERLSLVVLLTIARRFQGCLEPVTASQLSELVKIPTQIINECLNRLVAMELITTLRPAAGADAAEHRYQPARPLNRINLYEFKTLDDTLGEDPIGGALEHIDPILRHYDAALAKLSEQEFFQQSLEELFAAFPFDQSRPPFALGERVGK